MSTSVRNPRITLNMIPRDQVVGVEEHKVLVVGQKLSAGTAAAGLTPDVPRTFAEINTLFGTGSHLAMILRKFREINPYSRVDVLALADNGSGTAGTAKILFAGTATESKRIYVDVVSSEYHSYAVDVVSGDAHTAIVTKLLAAIALDTYRPFAETSTDTGASVTCTAKNKGTLCNAWLLRVRDAYNRPATVAGITMTLTGWADGATDPSLTSLFDPVENIRYQGILWPQAYTTSAAKTWIDARFNLDNDIKDGVVVQWAHDSYANLKTLAQGLNSPSWMLLTNEIMNAAYWKGPHLPEAPDVLAAQFLAARARRFETDIDISDLVVNNQSRDQFGGRHTASLPYFNTPFTGVGLPHEGSGFTRAEQLDLEGEGVSVVGANVTGNTVIAGTIVTTYQNDAAGNPDDTWKWLEWRDTHSIIREFFVNNLREDFAQHRLSVGATVANMAMVTEPILRAAMGEYYDILSQDALTVRGRDYRRIFDDELDIESVPDQRLVRMAAVTPMVSQFGVATGTIKFNFGL
jgi:phage tail sheath gpL-like